MRFWNAIVATAAVAIVAGIGSGQSNGAVGLKSGKDIFQAGCAGCHGQDGRGAPESTTVFERPSTFPDFTRCNQTTFENNDVWRAIIRDGGPARGFSHIMPSFRDVLTPAQINAVIGYMRGLCTDAGWPRGELNVPLALGTEKAYPEGEEVIRTSLNVSGAPGVASEIIHEQRFGQRNQIEVALPAQFVRPQPGVWHGGPSDIGVGVKRVMFANLRRGSLFSLFGGVTLPSGNVPHGLGEGTTQFETYAAYTQLLPGRSFAQFQFGDVLPHDTTKVPQSIFFRTALGKSLYSGGLPSGRMWSPMVEFLSSRDLVDGARTDWDVIPQMQITLSKRQHMRFNAGLDIPVTNTSGRQKQLVFYVLWDWLDGGLTQGWR